MRFLVQDPENDPDRVPNDQVKLPKLLILWLLLFLPLVAQTQEEEYKEPKLIMNGYLKNMVSATVLEDSTLWDNLVHNRLNFKWYPNSNLTGFLDFRNRIFFGDQVKSVNQLAEAFPDIVPRYSELIDENNDFFDLSWTIVRTFQRFLQPGRSGG